MALFFAATFAVFWRMGRLKRHVLGFSVGYLFFSLGFLVTHLLPGDAIYVFHTTQALYTMGTVLFLAGACERVGQTLPLKAIGLIYAINALVLAIAISLTNDAGPRLILMNMGYGAMFVVAITTLMSAPRRSWIDSAIIAVTVLQAADFFIRPTLSVAIEQSIPAESYQSSLYYSLIGLVLGIKSVASGMILLIATIIEWMESIRASVARDALTGLSNRGAFEDVMQERLDRAHKEGRPISLIVADIDHFKQVNDIWGHQAGDSALSGFGTLIESMIRGNDHAGRVGGEEFCIAVWDCEGEPAFRLADRIRANFARLPHPALSDDIRLTASFGVASARLGETYESLFRRADSALYEAKTGGRDLVVLYKGDPQKASMVAERSDPESSAFDLSEDKTNAA